MIVHRPDQHQYPPTDGDGCASVNPLFETLDEEEHRIREKMARQEPKAILTQRRRRSASTNDFQPSRRRSWGLARSGRGLERFGGEAVPDVR